MQYIYITLQYIKPFNMYSRGHLFVHIPRKCFDLKGVFYCHFKFKIIDFITGIPFQEQYQQFLILNDNKKLFKIKIVYWHVNK